MKLESKYLNVLFIAALAVFISGLSGLNVGTVNDGLESPGFTVSANQEPAVLQPTLSNNRSSDIGSFLGCLPEIEGSEKEHISSLLSATSSHRFYTPIQLPSFAFNVLPFFKLNIMLPRLRTVILLH